MAGAGCDGRAGVAGGQDEGAESGGAAVGGGRADAAVVVGLGAGGGAGLGLDVAGRGRGLGRRAGLRGGEITGDKSQDTAVSFSTIVVKPADAQSVL